MTEEVKTTAPEAPVEAPVATKKAKKGKRVVTSGQVHIQATFNNTIISISDKKGQVLAASSAGANGFRGSKKGTAYAAQIAAEKAGEIAKKVGQNGAKSLTEQAYEGYENALPMIGESTGGKCSGNSIRSF